MKKKLFPYVKNKILFYVFIYVFIYFLTGFILHQFGLTFLKWFSQLSVVFVAAGFLAGTIQIYCQAHRYRRFIAGFIGAEALISLGIVLSLFFQVNQEKIVEKDGKKMVQITHSFLLSNWVKYYDYENIFFRSEKERIYEVYDDSLSEYLYTIYYDKNGQFEKMVR